MEPAHKTTGDLKYVGSSDPELNGGESRAQSAKPKSNCLQRAGSALAGGLELFYYK